MQKFWEQATGTEQVTELEQLSLEKTKLLVQRGEPFLPRERFEELGHQIQDLEDRARAMGAKFLGTKRL